MGPEVARGAGVGTEYCRSAVGSLRQPDIIAELFNGRWTPDRYVPSL